MNRSAVIAVLALVVAGSAPSRAEEADAPERNDPLNAVVLIETSTSEASVFRPWQSYTDSSSGSGAYENETGGAISEDITYDIL